MLKSLFLVTDKFPYGNGESFLETEIIYLSKEFNKIYIIPNKIPNSGLRDFDHENINVLRPLYRNRLNSILNILFNLNETSFILKELRRNTHHLTFDYALKSIIIGLKTRAFVSIIKKRIRNNESFSNSVLYFYWANIPANSSIILSKKIKCAVRYHGGDLYEELPEHNGKIAYRSMLLEKANLNIFISKFGYFYVKEKYNTIKIKYLISRLSVSDFGYSRKSNDEKLRILTCSNVTLNKRINLLLEALQTIQIPVEWTHIGDGPLLKEIIKRSDQLPPNVHSFFKGQIPNTEVRKFISQNMVDLFINVSESEGVPVSIMEALSAGIPIMATNVGGTSELVDSSVGQLLNKDISSQKLSDAITSFYYTESKIIDTMRINSRMRFKELADATSQYSNFARLLSQI